MAHGQLSPKPQRYNCCELKMDRPYPSFLQLDTVFHGRYRVVGCLGTGAMGAIYEVADEVTNSRRALKVMLPSVIDDADLRARFAVEAKITGSIESDHIIRVSDAGIDAATCMPFMVMDLLRGETLGEMLVRRGALPPDEVIIYLCQVAVALKKTHARGIIHRDLKPANLFVTRRDDGTPCVKILDFGIAKMVSNSVQFQATLAVGTPIFMSPEQIRADHPISNRTDVYAFVHIAYALLVGEAYWTDDLHGLDTVYPLFAKVLSGLQEEPSARAARRHGVTLPKSFDKWMRRGTAIRPEDRFVNALSAVCALAQILDQPMPVWTSVWIAGETFQKATPSSVGSTRDSSSYGCAAPLTRTNKPDSGVSRHATSKESFFVAAVIVLGTCFVGSGGLIAWRFIYADRGEGQAHGSLPSAGPTASIELPPIIAPAEAVSNGAITVVPKPEPPLLEPSASSSPPPVPFVSSSPSASVSPANSDSKSTRSIHRTPKNSSAPKVVKPRSIF